MSNVDKFQAAGPYWEKNVEFEDAGPYWQSNTQGSKRKRRDVDYFTSSQEARSDTPAISPSKTRKSPRQSSAREEMKRRSTAPKKTPKEPPTGDTVGLEEKDDWISCDECEKWRRVSASTAKRLASSDTVSWTCSENTDDPFRQNCEVPEEQGNGQPEQPPGGGIACFASGEGKGQARRNRARKQKRASVGPRQKGHRYEKLSDDMRIVFDCKNWKRNKKTNIRYEKYKSADTVGEARALGATDADLIEDLYSLGSAELIIEEIAEVVQEEKVKGRRLTTQPGRTKGDNERSPALVSSEAIEGAFHYFDDINEKEWVVAKDKVKDDLKRIYIRANMDKQRPQTFQLFEDDRERVRVLEEAATAIRNDWGTYLAKHHPGFSSFSTTVGAYDEGQQREHTRVIGPGADKWENFRRRYKWFEQMEAALEIHLRRLLPKYAYQNNDVSEDATEGGSGDRVGGEEAPPDSDEKMIYQPLPELWDMHILQQKSGAALGGAVFSDHQDRHGERSGKNLAWTVTLVVQCKGANTGFFQWPTEVEEQEGRHGDEGSAACNGDEPSRNNGDAVTNEDGCNGDEPTMKNGGAVENEDGCTVRSRQIEATRVPERPASPTGPQRPALDKSVLPYKCAGAAVLFRSLAWHRSVIPTQDFETLKFSFFFTPPTKRSRRYYARNM